MTADPSVERPSTILRSTRLDHEPVSTGADLVATVCRAEAISLRAHGRNAANSPLSLTRAVGADERSDAETRQPRARRCARLLRRNLRPSRSGWIPNGREIARGEGRPTRPFRSPKTDVPWRTPERDPVRSARCGPAGRYDHDPTRLSSARSAAPPGL